MNDLNGYKIVQIGGLALAGVMLFLLMVVGWYETSTMITWLTLAFVGLGISYGAAKLNEAERERRLDEEARKRKLDRESRDESPR